MKKSEHACRVCGKATKNEKCHRCLKIWKRLIFTPHKHFLPERTQIKMIQKAIKGGISL